MQLRIGELEASLKRALAPLYIVSGDEPLLVNEAVDAIRSAARSAGFSEREVLENHARFQWSALLQSSQSMSLFSDKKLIEMRIPTGKPGRDGATALMAQALIKSVDILTIVTLPALRRETRNAAWFRALENAGVSLEIPTIERTRLGAWILTRLSRQKQSAPAAALQFIADRVEGNLLAAHQEIQKLGLLHGTGELSLEQVQDAVMNVARYDVFKLCQAMLSGDSARLVRMIEGLQAEGESAVLVHWAMTSEIRDLARAQAGLHAGLPLAAVVRELRIWGPRESLYEPALRRLPRNAAKAALRRAAELDKMVKGLRVPHRLGNVWDELTQLGLMITQPAEST